MDTDIFISYATPNLEFVTRLQQELTAQGFTARFDPDNDNNDLTHRTEIHKLIENSQVFLLVQSPDGLASDKVREELSRAINNYAKPVVALKWRPTPNIPRAMQRLLFQVGSSFDFAEESSGKNFEKFGKVLRSLVPAKTPPPAPATPSSSPKRRLGALGRKSPVKKEIGIIALGARVISSLVIPLDLPLEEQNVVSAELKWLFSAVDHLSRLRDGEIDPSRPINEPLPETAQKTIPTADNRFLGALSDNELATSQLFSNLSSLITRLNTYSKNLQKQLNSEISKGEAGKGDPFLQSSIKDQRIAIAKLLQEITQAVNKTYGVLITSPAQLIEILKNVNPLVLGSLVISKVIGPLGLPDEDEAFVAGEVKWLFSAAYNFQQVYRAVQARLVEEKKQLAQKGFTSQQTTADLRARLPSLRQSVLVLAKPVSVDIPPDAERSAEATNYVLNIPDGDDLIHYLKISGDIIVGASSTISGNSLQEGNVATFLRQVDSLLQGLNTSLAREAKMGEEGKRNVDLQNTIRYERGAVIQRLQDIARLMDEAYGIFVTTPDQLGELLENDEI